MANVEKKKLYNTGIWLIVIVLTVLITAIVIFIINNGSAANELKINESKNVSGINCTNKTQINFLFDGYTPATHKNTITAAFIDDQLSSITYAYEGKYANATEADHARDLIETNYNSTMTKKYGLEITDFTRNIAVNNDIVYASITATNNKKLNSKTAPMFMLSSTQAFPSSLNDIESAYENIGFSCAKEN